MPNLLVEYLKRHTKLSIPVCHNGVCFFGSNGKQKLIALTSLPCRSFSTCPSCERSENHFNVITEFFVPGYAGSFYQSQHNHVNPNSDLLKLVENHSLDNGLGDLKPFFAKTVKELEVWLWEFIVKSDDKKVKEEELIDTMVLSAFKHPQTYSAYYIAYEAFLLNRKYLLLDA